MHELQLCTLPATSAGVAVARSSQSLPEWLVCADSGNGLTAARWRRSRSELSEPVRLDEHLLSCCMTGQASVSVVVDGVRSSMQQRPGSVTFLPAGRPVQWTMDSPAQSVHLHIYIPAAALAPPGPPAAGMALAPAATSRRGSWIEGYFRLLWAELETCAQPEHVRASPFLDQTGSLLARHLQSQLVALPPAEPRPARRAGDVSALRPFVLRRIEAFVDANLAAPLTLERLAGRASMSVGHFLRAFQRATGVTPHRYVLERRLDRAGGLLQSSDERIAAIAARCGFASAAHFSATFHLHRGCTPTQFRRRH